MNKLLFILLSLLSYSGFSQGILTSTEVKDAILTITPSNAQSRVTGNLPIQALKVKRLRLDTLLKVASENFATLVINKADLTYVNTQLVTKTTTAQVTTIVAPKMDSTRVKTLLGLKANTTDVNDKVSTATFNSVLSTKANSSDLALKENTADVNAKLNFKVNNSLFADTITALKNNINTKSSIAYANQKLHNVSSKTELSTLLVNGVVLAHFDNSDWDFKAGNVTDNGGSGTGTIVRINSSFYWKRKLPNGIANPKMFGALGDGNTDDTQALLSCFAAHKNIEFSEGTYILKSPITMNFHTVTAPRFGVFLYCAGTDGFYFTKNTFNKLSNIYMVEFSANLVTAGTRLKTALRFDGILDQPCYNTLIDNVYANGFNIGAYGSYLSETTFNKFNTISCNNGIKLFGQSLNNHIIACHILADNIGIETIKDALANGGLGHVGEGLMIDNTLVAQCNIAIKCNGFLLLQINNSVIDLNIASALDMQNCKGLKVSNSWFYAQQNTIVFNAVSSGIGDGQISQSVSFSNNIIESVQAVAVLVGDGNKDMTFTNNKIETSGNANAYIFNTSSNTSSIVFANNNVKTPYSPYNIYVGGSSTYVVGNTGDALPYYADPTKRNVIKDNFLQSIETKYTTFPTAGTWLKGDRIINSNPAVGQPKAWVCTVAGTPGTWVSEGNL